MLEHNYFCADCFWFYFIDLYSKVHLEKALEKKKKKKKKRKQTP